MAYHEAGAPIRPPAHPPRPTASAQPLKVAVSDAWQSQRQNTSALLQRFMPSWSSPPCMQFHTWRCKVTQCHACRTLHDCVSVWPPASGVHAVVPGCLQQVPSAQRAGGLPVRTAELLFCMYACWLQAHNNKIVSSHCVASDVCVFIFH